MSTGADDGKKGGEMQELRQGPRELYHSLKVYQSAGQSVPAPNISGNPLRKRDREGIMDQLRLDAEDAPPQSMQCPTRPTITLSLAQVGSVRDGRRRTVYNRFPVPVFVTT